MARPKKGTGKGSRRSRAEAMTGAKENAAEVRTGELGLGEPVVIDSDTFGFHLRAIKGATEKKDTANNLLRNCFKAAKQVNEHLPEAIKLAISEERSNDPAKLKKRLEVMGIALRETGSPVQLTVHDSLLGDVKGVAYKRGKDMGTAGKALVNVYPAGSDLAAEMERGWQDGQRDLLGISDGVDAANGIGHNSNGATAEATAG